MRCPVCWHGGYANIDLESSKNAENGITYMKYKCKRCETGFTIMFATPKNTDSEYKKLLLANRKIQAIKNRRAITGEGLHDAKHYIDSLQLKMIAEGELEDPTGKLKRTLEGAMIYHERRFG
jgi:ribosomal protein L7/L12